MATWTYSDWRTYADLTGRKNRVALYMQELSEYLTQETGADGQSISSNNIQQELARLEPLFKELEERVAETASSSGGGRVMQYRRREA